MSNVVIPEYFKKQFRVGIELEFIIRDNGKGVSRSGNEKIEGLLFLTNSQFLYSFRVPHRQRRLVTDMQTVFHTGADEKTKEYLYNFSYIIILLKIFPKKPVYQFINGIRTDVTEIVNRMIENTDVSDEKAVRAAAHFLRYRCHITTIPRDEYYEHDGDALLTHWASYLNYSMQEQVIPQNEEYIHRKDYDSDVTKNKPIRSYLSSEYMPHMRDDEYGLELQSRVMKIEEVRGYLQAFFDAMQNPASPTQARTNKNCGIHINISHPRFSEQNMNAQTYSCLFNEQKWQRVFDRENIEYCEDYYDRIKDHLTKYMKLGVLKKEDLDTLDGVKFVSEFVEKVIDTGKFSSMNTGNLEDHGYVEFRIPGGKNYEQRIDDVMTYLDELMVVLYQMTKVKARKNELLQPFYKELVKDTIQKNTKLSKIDWHKYLAA
jgi:hypothetical protein